ncbi:hypothetical protein LINPERPRIM_LOCUS30660 [Linum perenne]
MSCGCRRMVLPMWNHPVKDEQKGNTRTSDIATSLPCCLQVQEEFQLTDTITAEDEQPGIWESHYCTSHRSQGKAGVFKEDMN